MNYIFWKCFDGDNSITKNTIYQTFTLPKNKNVLPQKWKIVNVTICPKFVVIVHFEKVKQCKIFNDTFYQQTHKSNSKT